MADETMAREGLIWKVMKAIAYNENKALDDTMGGDAVDRRYIIDLLNEVEAILRLPRNA